MIRLSLPFKMNLPQVNAVFIPRDEFFESLASIQELLAHNADPGELIVEDPFMAARPVKVDLRKHLQNLYDRMSEIGKSMSPATRMVRIDFN